MASAFGSGFHSSAAQRPFDIVRIAYSEVSQFLSSSPCNHVFTIEQDNYFCSNYAPEAYSYEYSVADCKEIDESLFEGVLSPFLEHLKVIVRPIQIFPSQMLPLVSMNSQQQQRIYRTIIYGVTDLFPEESCDNPPPDGRQDNVAGDHIFQRVQPVPAWYKSELLSNEWCKRNVFHHCFVVTMQDSSGREVFLKLYTNRIKDLAQIPIDLLTPDGKVTQFETLGKCFSANHQMKQAFTAQLVPMLETIAKSIEEYFEASSGEPSTDSTFIEQDNLVELFGRATAVPPDLYRNLQAQSKSNNVNSCKHPVRRWLLDGQEGYLTPKRDPILSPNLKRACEHVPEPNTAACGPAKYSKKIADDEKPVAVAKTQDPMMKITGKPSTSEWGESGFSSAQMSRFSSFNQAKGVMLAEKQLSMEIEAEQYFQTEFFLDGDDDSDE